MLYRRLSQGTGRAPGRGLGRSGCLLCRLATLHAHVAGQASSRPGGHSTVALFSFFPLGTAHCKSRPPSFPCTGGLSFFATWVGRAIIHYCLVFLVLMFASNQARVGYANCIASSFRLVCLCTCSGLRSMYWRTQCVNACCYARGTVDLNSDRETQSVLFPLRAVARLVLPLLGFASCQSRQECSR